MFLPLTSRSPPPCMEDLASDLMYMYMVHNAKVCVCVCVRVRACSRCVSYRSVSQRHEVEELRDRRMAPL